MTGPNNLRNIEKIRIALSQATVYFEKTSEANAATHNSERVLYSPIVTTLNEALHALNDIEAEFEDQT